MRWEANNLKNVTAPQVIQNQYGTDGNLDSRIRVKRKFSTGKQKWAGFLLDNFRIKPNDKILELGCGNAVFWKAVSDKLPENIQLTLSDFSSGMLDSAKTNTSGLDFVHEYAVIDAQTLPYNNGTFDIVIANYMLYHVPNVDKALREISRVLKPSGVFYAATFGKNNLKEVTETFHSFDKNIDPVLNDMTEVFGLETGEALLNKFFGSVKLKKFENGLHITDFDSLVEYFLSYKGMGNVSDVLCESRTSQFINFLKERFSEHNFFNITQDEGLFVSNNAEVAP
jgi:ubiquinone/menaquinone biosynthesis C-methylase UbiE